MARKKLTEAQKLKRKRNRVKFYGLHVEYTIKADKAGAKGYYEACSEYRRKAQEHYNTYRENGGRDYS